MVTTINVFNRHLQPKMVVQPKKKLPELVRVSFWVYYDQSGKITRRYEKCSYRPKLGETVDDAIHLIKKSFDSKKNQVYRYIEKIDLEEVF